MSYTYKTLINLDFAGLGQDHAIPLEIVYEVRKGSPMTREQPAEGDSVHITKATLTDSKGHRYKAHDWLWEILETAEELTAELLEEARGADVAAADEHADAVRRERQL